MLRLARYFLQHLPDFKGIETNAYTGDKYDLCLQHLPDFKGIETEVMILSSHRSILQHLPDFKGIETLVIDWIMVILLLQHLPDFKGIETGLCYYGVKTSPCSTSLTLKGYTQKSGLSWLMGRFFNSDFYIGYKII